MTAPPVYPRGDQYPPFGDWTTIKGVVSSAYLERDQQMIVRWSPFWESMTETGYVRPVDESLNPDVEARFPTVGDVMQMIAQGATTLPGERILGLRASDSGLIVRAGVDETSAHEMEVSWPELSTLINSVRDLRDETEEYATDARGVIDEAVGDLRGELAVINGIASAAAQIALDAAAGKPVGVSHYSGTGFPNGVVAAPVGSTYTDLAATNGAIEWIKASGTGNTGWVVKFGDTGSCALATWDTDGVVTGTLPTGISPAGGLRGGLYIRRILGKVSYSIVGGRVSSPLTGLPVPFGFRVLSSPYPVVSFQVDSGVFSAKVGAAMIFPSSVPVGTLLPSSVPEYALNMEWEVGLSAPWPTSLPGLPA